MNQSTITTRINYRKHDMESILAAAIYCVLFAPQSSQTTVLAFDPLRRDEMLGVGTGAKFISFGTFQTKVGFNDKLFAYENSLNFQAPESLDDYRFYHDPSKTLVQLLVESIKQWEVSSTTKRQMDDIAHFLCVSHLDDVDKIRMRDLCSTFEVFFENQMHVNPVAALGTAMVQKKSLAQLVSEKLDANHLNSVMERIDETIRPWISNCNEVHDHYTKNDLTLVNTDEYHRLSLNQTFYQTVKSNGTVMFYQFEKDMVRVRTMDLYPNAVDTMARMFPSERKHIVHENYIDWLVTPQDMVSYLTLPALK